MGEILCDMLKLEGNNLFPQRDNHVVGNFKEAIIIHINFNSNPERAGITTS